MSHTSIKPTFIDTACLELDYNNGSLIEISSEPKWKYNEKADWIKLCELVDKATSHKTLKIFFVNDEPLIVFTRSNTSDNLHKIYNRIWCMSRPRLLFLETLTELMIFDLATKPVRDDDELTESALVVVKSIVEVKDKLAHFRREQIESGRAFEDIKFANTECRADRALIRDLKIVRNKLYNAGLNGENLKYAHSLIGKSIFIRYLEDRGILSRQYFLQLANEKEGWADIINTNLSRPYVDEKMATLCYPKILASKSFTYALFRQIAIDFNGDIFSTDKAEETLVTEEHLSILNNFLDGNIDNNSLFFWAYRFDIIPIELISNIYEEFYHYNVQQIGNNEGERNIDDKGTFYTPTSLVEFVLRRTLTEETLKNKPVVLDPACGSGIFIVETFRKIVRFELYQKKKEELTRFELLTILRNQVRGIELNEEAIRIAAFSLYLAFLHYQAPPDILLQVAQGKKLPHLIFTNNKKTDEDYYDILLHSNAFSIPKEYSLRIDKSIDVIVGNPPWGAPPSEDLEGRKALTVAMDWCASRSYPTSDKERSQAFIWRSIDFLREGGVAGLIVSSGILLKQSHKSNIFKQNFLKKVTIKEVVNFIHVRDVFFNGAISPFISIVFQSQRPEPSSFIEYWTARRTKIIEHTKSVILDKTDFKFFSYSETKSNDIWKIFYFGNHRDLSLINKVRLNNPLQSFEFVPNEGAPRRQGFIEGNKALPSDWLTAYKELPASCFNNRYNKIPFSKVLVPVPPNIKERGAKYIYEGKRILVGKVSQKAIPKGQLIARLETKKFSFRNTINCIKLKNDYEEFYEVILGIIWSSFARYYFFMTCSKWGVWHDQVYLDEILNLPISLPDNSELKEKISTIVNQLQNEEFDKPITQNKTDLFSPVLEDEKKFGKTSNQLEKELDNLIFQLYRLSPAEIELIKDRCELDIDFFYNDSESISVKPIRNILSENGDISSVGVRRNSGNGLDVYIRLFLTLWNKEIDTDKKFTFRIIYPQNSPLVAVVFDLRGKESAPVSIENIDSTWAELLDKLGSQTVENYSSNIYIDGIVRATLSKQIIIIKRNEHRLWTNTAAREDVDATILQAMLNQTN